MATLIFISHPEVVVDAQTDVTKWGLSDVGHARARQFARSDTLSSVTELWSSAEEKALQTARHFTDHLGIRVQTAPLLGENDRSSTGFLPSDVFEDAANAFFEYPKVSFKGWEMAVDAQQRIERAVRGIIGGHTGGDLAVVSHGAVGTLLYCALAKLPISRAYDQPGQGHYWTAQLADLVPRHTWKPLG